MEEENLWMIPELGDESSTTKSEKNGEEAKWQW